MEDKKYVKPMLYDMNETELQSVDGGAFIVAVGVLVAAVLVAGAYTVVAAGMVVDVGAAVHATIGATTWV
ncbi:hypothetical protein E5329_25350 [Petralouisia muris]|uniref:Uncharacterized protein n=1 Tax=Petralouisia muris TaxID=3032872 RepID=A0AC61RP99_9FIRM|nr:hypothetical protein [Petralouisia muris]TGY88726.1 hypothetical protein E5329_25350 [Petralouisia muris]